MSYASPSALECLARTLAESCGASGAGFFDVGSSHRFGSWRRSHCNDANAVKYELGSRFDAYVYDGRRPASPDVLKVTELALQALVECDGLRRDVRKFLRQAQISHEIGREVSSLADLEQIFHLVAARSRELFHCDVAGVAIADASDGGVAWQAVDGSQRTSRVTTVAEPRERVVMRVIDTRRLVIIDDVGTELTEETDTLLSAEGLRAILAVPLRVKRGLNGCLLVGFRAPRRFSDEEVETFKNFAAQVVIAIENAELYERTRRERALMHSIVESIDEGLLLIDTEGRVAHLNRRAEELFDIRGSTLIGRSIENALEPLCRVSTEPLELRRLMLHLLSAEQRFPTAEFNLGSTPIVELRLTSFQVFNAGGTAIGRGLLFRDITFERHVDALKTDVIAIVSHELRSPLASIRGCSTALLEESGGRDAALQRSYLELIDRESARLTELLSNLADASLIDAGVFQIDPQASDPISLAHRVAARKNRTITIGSTALARALLFDHHRIEQVLDNLLDNAMKYSPEDTPIDVSFEDFGHEVVFTVSDHGDGIPLELQRHVFERFYRIDGLRRKGDGSGLGLFICRGIVAAHGGRIWLEARETRGTSVSFALPRATALV